MTKPTESQDAIEMFRMELDAKEATPEKAQFILDGLPAIKRAYGFRVSEIAKEEEASIPKLAKDADVDAMIKANEDRKVREHQTQVRLNTIDRLVRQASMGAIAGWQQSLVGVFDDMHAMVAGSMLAR